MLWKFKLAGYLHKHFFLLIDKNSREGKKKLIPYFFLAYTKNFPTTCAKIMREDVINNFKIIIYFLAMDGETFLKALYHEDCGTVSYISCCFQIS